jgi:hypothetical protein
MTHLLRIGLARLVLALACGLAMFASTAREARASNISMTIVANGFTIPVDALTTGGNSGQYGTVDLHVLNALLTANGSVYQFSALGGVSTNDSGTGSLQLTGGIFINNGVKGSTSLTITETGSNYSIGVTAGLFSSSSTANFTSAGPGNSHSASSSFNSTASSTYTVASQQFGPDPEIGSTSAIIPFNQNYSLTNTISFNLVPSMTASPQDSFSVAAQAAVAPVPEPASVVLSLSSLPLVLALARRHNRRAKSDV